MAGSSKWNQFDYRDNMPSRQLASENPSDNEQIKMKTVEKMTAARTAAREIEIPSTVSTVKSRMTKKKKKTKKKTKPHKFFQCMRLILSYRLKSPVRGRIRKIELIPIVWGPLRVTNLLHPLPQCGS